MAERLEAVLAVVRAHAALSDAAEGKLGDHPRHALRAALAVGTGYVIATLLPWGSHDYWVTLTIVVVLRGSLAQTL